MKKIAAMIILAFAVSFVSCGEKVKELKEAGEAIGKMAEAANNAQANQDAGTAKMEERRKKGDTLAMDFKKLQEFLPKSVDGYTADEPEGSSVNMGVASLSNAKIEFKKGNDRLTVELTDYNAGYQLLTAATLAWSMSSETKEKIEKSFDPGVKPAAAFEQYYKIDKRAEVSYVVGYRFILHLRADNQTGTDFLKKVASSMRLQDLANM